MSAIRFRHLDDAALSQLLTDLVSAKYSDQHFVDFNGNKLEFRSAGALEAMLLDVEKEVASREAAAAGKTTSQAWTFRPALTSGKGYL